MDVEERIQALEKLVTVNTDRFSAINQQMHTLAVDMGHIKTQLGSFEQSLNSHHDVSTQVGEIQREVDGFHGNVQAITALATQAMTTASQANGVVNGLMPRVADLEGHAPIANVIFGGNGIVVGGYGVVSIVRTGNGTYDINLTAESLTHAFHAQVTLVGGIQKALKDQSTCAVGKFSTNKRLHLETFAIQNGNPITWDAAEVCLVVWR
jgi:hypothetical protein